MKAMYTLRRKDGKPKLKSRRNLPEFDSGFREKYPRETTTPEDNTVMSFFSGCGGLDLGLQGEFIYLGKTYERLPFEIVGAYDNLPDAVETYRLNIRAEIETCDLSTSEPEQFNYADVVVGGFPCQDFSSSGPKVGLNGKRAQLYTVIRDYLQHHQPKVFVAENVPYMLRLNAGEYLRKIVSDFEDCGYVVRIWELNCPDFGLAQSRKRIIVVGVRSDIEGFPAKPIGEFASGHRAIEDALEDLKEITDESITNQSQYFIASKASAGGGQGDHKNERGKLAYCIRANSRGRIQFHYELERRLTVRECARLQAFPDEFVFPFSTQRNLTLIGNAVPPIVGHAVGKSIASFLYGKTNLTNNYETNSVHSAFQPTQMTFQL